MASTETETETGTETGPTATTSTTDSDSSTMPPSLQALMSAADDDDHTPRAAGQTRRRRRSEFDIYRDANANAKPAQPSTSPGTQLHRERLMRERELRALEEEYLAGSSSGKGKGKGRASVIEEVTEETDEEGTEDAPRPRRTTTTKPSASSILSHGHPDPALTPMPAPPLSRLHRRFATGTTPSPAVHRAAPPRRPSKLSPTPVLAPAPADPDVSPLQHMRRLRAQFEALRPPASPTPEPTNPKPTRPKPQHHPPPPPPPSTNSKPTTTADLLAHYTFTLAHLPALTHHSRTATLTLTPPSPTSPGHLTLNLRPPATSPTSPPRGSSHNTYTIPPHGLPITITTATTATTHTRTHALADLPLQHLPALRYAKRFVAAVQRATVVGRVEVREPHGGGGVWAATRWADGRFEAVRARGGGVGEAGGQGGEGEVVVRIDGGRVRLWAAGRRVRDVDVDGARWAPAVDRAMRMRSACWRALDDDEEEEEEGGGAAVVGGGVSVPLPLPPPPPAATATPNSTHAQQPHSRYIPFPIDAGTTFVPAVGWCRRDAHTGWWGMLFLDGVRLDVDPGSGDAVWTDGVAGGGGGGAQGRRVLVGGMGLREVRERVRRFVDRGL